MKIILPLLTLLSLLSNIGFGQNIVNSFTKEGKIYVQFDNGNTIEIVSEGINTVIGYSNNKSIVVYERLEQPSRKRGMEGEEAFDKISIRTVDVKTKLEKVLFTTCLDGIGGTQPSYANSSIYPKNNLCGVEYAFLSMDGERLYFQTSGWTTSPAIHFFNLKENRLVFYMAGWLQKVTNKGVEVQITGIETTNNMGNIESKGRYTQICLFDFNGNFIKEISPKEF
jgi:hypothetical protein